MVDEENLDIRTINNGYFSKKAVPVLTLIQFVKKVYEKKSQTYAKRPCKKPVRTLRLKFGIPIINKENFGNSDSYFGGRIGKKPTVEKNVLKNRKKNS